MNHMMAVKHDPDNGQYGDCFRAVLGYLLGLDTEDVPHFMADPDRGMDKILIDVDQWLAQRGLRYMTMPMLADNLDVLLKSLADRAPGMRFEVVGESPRHTDHCVVAQDGKIVHDPAHEGGGLIGEASTGHYWIGMILPVAVHGTSKRDADND